MCASTTSTDASSSLLLLLGPNNPQTVNLSQFSRSDVTARVSLMSWLEIDTARQINVRPSLESGSSAAPQIAASTANAGQNRFSG